MLAQWLKQNFSRVWWAVFFLCTLPALYLAYLYGSDGLGPNPLAMLMHTTGRAALVLLAVTLLVTPLRRWVSNVSRWLQLRYGKRLADWNWTIRLRRQLGLWAFAYACLHAWIFVHFDLGYDWAAGRDEVAEKPYILAGLLALVLLVPLAVTSTSAMIRRLGRNWIRLHRLIYVIAVLGLLHFWWMMKPGLWTPWPDTVVLTVLLGYRLLLGMGLLHKWDGSDGRESAVRPAHQVLDTAQT